MKESSQTKKRSHYWWLVLGLTLLYGIDRASKVWAHKKLVGSEYIEIIGSFLQLHFVGNNRFLYLEVPGWIALTVITLVMVGMIAITVKSMLMGRIWDAAALLLVLVGAWSNMFDRIQFGYVIDFIAIPQSVFNLSDIYIVTGVAVIFFLLSKEDTVNQKKEGREKK